MDESSLLGRIQSSGFTSASSIDLLALAISTGEADMVDAELRARTLIREVGRIHGLSDLSLERMKSYTAFDGFDVMRHFAWFELGRRAGVSGPGDRDEIMNPDAVARILEQFRREKREHFGIVMLDTKGKLLRWTTIHVGTLSSSIVGPREVFREAIREGASSIILFHNHPSGDPAPSEEDIAITGKLAELGVMLDIPVLDHVIIGNPRFSSLKRLGLMA